MDPAARVKAGLADGLIRLSVGIEALEDLRADLAGGLERASAACGATSARLETAG
jgi:cystathionine beta-lyase/cystathionine gamma-synthase